VANPKHPGRRWREWRTVRTWLIAVLVGVGVVAQFAWVVRWHELTSGEGVDGLPGGHATLVHTISFVGLASLVCAMLLGLPDAIQWARQAYRDHQEFKDRFR
jgi:hypothetical protein